MTLRTLLLLVLAVCIAVLVLGLRRHMDAGRAALAAEQRLLAVAADAQEVLDLRARQATLAGGDSWALWGEDTAPGQGMIAHVTAAMADAGIPSDRLLALEPLADAPVGPGRPARHGLRLSLEPLTPPELGAFLHAWRSRQRVWTVTHAELVSTARQDQPDPQYRATLRLTAVSADDAPRQHNTDTTP